ncbi:MAG TPA: cupredoxin family copper-binding protein [Stellaceae bacterium]|nr:cupredoxin family copper-binding protein [Stellaceae bacterium]
MGKMQFRPVRLTLAAIGICGLSAAMPHGASAGEHTVKAALAPATVAIDAHAFAPATLTVTAGTTITWKNGDDTVHSIVADNKSFRSGALDTDESWSHTFATPGQYSYFCSLHPFMTGKIIVVPAGKQS